MARLVAPVNVLTPSEERIIEFKGLNRQKIISDGEMPDMTNLCSDDYPVLSPRRLRGELDLPTGVVRPQQIIVKHSKLCMLGVDANDATNFYYDGVIVPEVTGLSAATYMVAINTKICFFPERKFITITKIDGVITVDGSSYGDLGASESNVSQRTVTISNEDARITVTDGTKWAYDDAINISGTLDYTDGNGVQQSDVACEASCVIEEVDTNTLILPRETFIEITGDNPSSIKFTGSITREVPDLEYVVEWNNRLWGVSDNDNTIYACKLGDPKNWQYYQGTSLDAYYAQQGTDGDWTGVGKYSSHIIFFKEESMARVYGTSPSTFQIDNSECFGVEKGSARSVVTINDVVYYKSKIGVMAYYGSAPVLISDCFNITTKNAVAGTDRNKYYISLKKQGGEVELLVYDIAKNLWHREDKTMMRSCVTIGNKLYFTEYTNDPRLCSESTICSDWLFLGSDILKGKEVVIGSESPTETYENLDWSATFGPFDEYVENRKIYSRLFLRFITEDPAARVKVYISIDKSIDEDEWELVWDFYPAEKGGEMIPIVPRRCDRYSIRVDGTGLCSIKSLTRNVRAGTHGKL